MKLGVAHADAMPRDTMPELIDPTDAWSTESSEPPADEVDEWEVEILIADDIATLEGS